MKSLNGSVYIMSDGNRTVATAELFNFYRAETVFMGKGSSGREPGDKPDAAIGEDLAVARALRSLASKLERRAAGRMRHVESIKAHKEQILRNRKLVAAPGPEGKLDIPTAGARFAQLLRDNRD